ncbi:MAG TPA: hypothetical protein PKY95_10815, partial [candidate division Zixibacteria bacterium]|nr:hypothetical protein [candidate division Zixibacteria bacterium]
MFTIVPETNINFIGARKIAFAISIVLVIGGLFATVLVWTGKADLGIDFAGGTMIYAAFEKPVAIEDLRMAVSSAAPDAQITQLQNFEKPNAFILKTKRPTVEGEGQQRLTAIEGAIRQRFTDNSFEKVSEHIIGPAVGESLRSDTQKAVLLSLL